MSSDFLLVERNESNSRQFLVCKKTDLVDKHLRSVKRQDLVGKYVAIQWKQKEDYNVRVLNVGKVFM